MYASINKDKSIRDIHPSQMKAVKQGDKGPFQKVEDMGEAMLTRAFNFATGKDVARARNRDKALAAIKQYVKDKPAPTKPKQDTKAAQPTDKPATAKKKSIKVQIRELLTVEGSPSMIVGQIDVVHYTVEELVEHTGGTTSSVRTALSDLKSEKYCGEGGPLNIVKSAPDADGRIDYYIPQGTNENAGN